MQTQSPCPKSPKKQFALMGAAGLLGGLINGLLGAGGGMVLVPLLNRAGLPAQKAHATCVAVIAPICLVSGIFYICRGFVSPGDILPFLPALLAGGAVGTYLLTKIKSVWLHRVFGVFVLWAAYKMLFAK